MIVVINECQECGAEIKTELDPVPWGQAIYDEALRRFGMTTYCPNHIWMDTNRYAFPK